MKTKSGQYPQKTGINLVIKEKGQFHPGRVIPMVAAVILAAAAFGKFGVADRLAEVNRAQDALNTVLQQQAQLLRDTADYPVVLEEYNRYASGWMTDDERLLVDRIEVLGLIDRELINAGSVKQFSATGNLLSVNISGVTLSSTSRIVERLYTYPIVAHVEVFTAATQPADGDDALVNLVITLGTETAEEGGDDQ